MASDFVSGIGEVKGGRNDAGSGDISATKTSSCSITDISLVSVSPLSSSCPGDSFLSGGVSDISGRETALFSLLGTKRDSVSMLDPSPSSSNFVGVTPPSKEAGGGGDALGVGESPWSWEGVDALFGDPGT